MGFKRYLFRNDAIYGYSSYWFNFNYCISTNCFMASSLSIWTVEFISLLSNSESNKSKNTY